MLFAIGVSVALGYSQSVDTVIRIPLHQLACLDNDSLCIRYDSMGLDSRCSVFDACFWEGDVAIKVIANGDTVTLSESGTYGPNGTSIGKYTIRVLEVFPLAGCTDTGLRCPTLDSLVKLNIVKTNTSVIRQLRPRVIDQNGQCFAVDPLGRKQINSELQKHPARTITFKKTNQSKM